MFRISAGYSNRNSSLQPPPRATGTDRGSNRYFPADFDDRTDRQLELTSARSMAHPRLCASRSSAGTSGRSMKPSRHGSALLSPPSLIGRERLEKRYPSDGGPRVRIHLPPAASQERTPSSKTAISAGTCRRRRRSEQSRFAINARMRPNGGRQDGGSRSAIGSAVAGTAWLDAVREC